MIYDSLIERERRNHFEREMEIMIESRKVVIDTTISGSSGLETQLRIRLAEQQDRLQEIQPIDVATFGDLIRAAQSDPEKKMTEDEAYRFRLGI